MSSTQMSREHATRIPTAATIDLKLEVVVVPVSDVDRAKRFYGARIVARERGRTPDEAANDATLHMESARR
jgi:hypothetical protein